MNPQQSWATPRSWTISPKITPLKGVWIKPPPPPVSPSKDNKPERPR